MQTTIQYGDVLIKDVLTESIDHSVAKDPTGVDQMGVRVVGIFTGVVHCSSGDHTGKKVTRLNTDLSGILQKLTKDRCQFTMKIGGSVLYNVRPGAREPAFANAGVDSSALIDIDNGPKTHVTVTKITAGYSAHIRFQIEFLITNCGGAGTINSTGLINFRFWVGDDVDCRTWLTTRVYQGRIRVAHKNISPQALARVVTVPPLEDGFQRRFIRWHESDNGLELDFAYQDEEMIAAPPFNGFTGEGAIDWDGHLSLSTETQGATSTAEVVVRLTGPKSTSVAALENIAFLVIQSKLQLRKLVVGKGSFFWQSFGVVEQLAANSIEVAARIFHTGNTQLLGGLMTMAGSELLAQPLGNMGIGYDPGVAMNPGPSAGVGGLYLSLLQTPCNPNTMPQTLTYPQSKPYKIRRKREQVTQSPGDQLQDFESLASRSHLNDLYLYYYLDSDIMLDSGTIAMPTGAASDSKQGSLAFVNLYRPTCEREVRISAGRIDQPPELPAPNLSFDDENGITHKPIGAPRVVPSAPQLSADGRTLLFEVEMQLRFGLSRVPNRNESLPIGVLPYRIKGADRSNSLPGNAFVAPGRILS
jgi:hypothetical protein